jgi:hypothetical protein
MNRQEKRCKKKVIFTERKRKTHNYDELTMKKYIPTGRLYFARKEDKLSWNRLT